MDTQSPRSQTDLMGEKRRSGLRTFASDQAALQHAKESQEPEAAQDVKTEQADATPTKPEPVPQAAPIKAHKTVKKLNEQGEHIPAFHELSKQDDGPKTKIAIDDTEGAFGGTIITDTKKDRFKFFPALGASISNWWKGITTPKKKHTNTYAVPQAELRKGVIQKATSKTGTMFTADNSTLRERIKQRDAQPVTTPPVHKSETTWSANTEPGFALLEEPEEVIDAPKTINPEPQNVQVTYTKRASSDSDQNKQTISTPEPQPEPETIDRWAAAANQPEPQPVKKPTSITPFPESVQNTPNPKEIARVKTQPRGRLHFLEFDTNLLSLILFFAITGFIVIVFFSGDVLKGLLPQREQLVDVTTESVKLLRSATQRDMLLSNLSPLAIEEVVGLSQRSFGNSIQELRLMLDANTPLSTARFLSLIDAEVETSFTQNIAAVRLAVANQPVRGILFGVIDPTTARGGMLEWENNMLPSVSTVFQNNLASSSVTTSFVDEKINATDVRVLYTNDGVTLIVYGFIDDNIILIAPDHTQFQTILDYK